MAPTLFNEKEPEPGDLIEIDRGTYQHWAVYIGNGCVVHLAPPSEVPGAGASSVMSVLYEKAIVKMEDLWDVVGTNQWEVNNALDKKYEPRPVKEILEEAHELAGTELNYCVFRGNCEHFATVMRYGKAESRQVRKAVEVGVGACVATMVGLGVLALAGAIFGSGRKERQNRDE